jgi:hypothetical protein
VSTTIAVNCTACGTDNRVPSDAMLAGVDSDELDLRFAGFVCWICSGCQDMVIEPVAWRLFLTLLTAGVLLLDDAADETERADGGTGTDGPATGWPGHTHPERPLDGPAFTADDELDLHELLANDEWFPLVLAVDGSEPRT